MLTVAGVALRQFDPLGNGDQKGNDHQNQKEHFHNGVFLILYSLLCFVFERSHPARGQALDATSNQPVAFFS
jgi:uncharacterized membrane protein YidH (DUF202 family)